MVPVGPSNRAFEAAADPARNKAGTHTLRHTLLLRWPSSPGVRQACHQTHAVGQSLFMSCGLGSGGRCFRTHVVGWAVVVSRLARAGAADVCRGSCGERHEGVDMHGLASIAGDFGAPAPDNQTMDVRLWTWRCCDASARGGSLRQWYASQGHSTKAVG